MTSTVLIIAAAEDVTEGVSGRRDGMPELGLPDDEITTWVDTGAFGGQKFESLAAYASQAENIFFLQLGQERFTELMGTETFVRVRDITGVPTPEDSLFAGLR